MGRWRSAQVVYVMLSCALQGVVPEDNSAAVTCGRHWWLARRQKMFVVFREQFSWSSGYTEMLSIGRGRVVLHQVQARC